MNLVNILIWAAGLNIALYGGIIGILALLVNPFFGIAILAIIIVIAKYL